MVESLSLLDRVLRAISAHQGQLDEQCKVLASLDEAYEREKARLRDDRKKAESSLVAQQAAARSMVHAEARKLEHQFETRRGDALDRMRQELSAIEDKRQELQRTEQRIPADLRHVAVEMSEGCSADDLWEAESFDPLFRIIEDTSFFAGAKRLFGCGSHPSRSDACAHIKGMIAHNRRVLKEREQMARNSSSMEELRGAFMKEQAALEEKAAAVGRAAVDERDYEGKMNRLQTAYEQQKMQVGQTDETSSFVVLLQEFIDEAEVAARSLCCSAEAWREPYRAATEFPDALPLFWVDIPVEGYRLSVAASRSLRESASCWIHAYGCKDAVCSGVRALVAAHTRLMPLGSLEVFWFDPVCRGRSLGRLAAWACSPSSDESSVLIEAATSEREIRELFALLEQRMGDVGLSVAVEGSVQRHNQLVDKGERIPYTLVVLSDADARAYGEFEWQTILSLVENGNDLGVSVIVLDGEPPDNTAGGEPDEFRRPYTDQAKRDVRASCIEIAWDEDGFSSMFDQAGTLSLRPMSEALVPTRFIQEVDQTWRIWRGRSQNENIQTIPSLESYTIDRGIFAPLGETASGQPVALEFGVDYAHAIVTGSTGSGKSVLLHNVIASVCSQYSPTDLDVWLVDYKKTEFGRYRKDAYRFPHISFVGLDGSPDFVRGFVGLLMDEFVRRQRLILDAGANEITTYNAQHLEGEHLPRLLVIIDEFHRQAELMAEGDEYLKTRFEQILRESRAYGMHIFISDQTLSGMRGLTDAARKQMAGRVLLKWAESNEVVDMFGSASCVDDRPLETGEAYVRLRGNVVRCKTRFVSEEHIAGMVERMRRADPASFEIRPSRFYDANERELVPANDVDVTGTSISIGSVPVFNDPVFGIELRSRKRENVFVLDSRRGLSFDLLTLLSEGARRTVGCNITIVVDEARLSDEPTHRWVEKAARTLSARVLNTLAQVCEFLQEAPHLSDEFIVLFDFEDIAERMEQLPRPKAGERQESGASSGNILAKGNDPASFLALLGCDEAVTCETNIDAVSGDCALPEELSPTGSSIADLFDMREALLELLLQGGTRQVHLCWVSERIPLLSAVFFGLDYFGDSFDAMFSHRFAGKCAAMDSIALGMSSRASTIPDDERDIKMVYADRNEEVTLFKPYETK